MSYGGNLLYSQASEPLNELKAQELERVVLQYLPIQNNLAIIMA